MNISGNTILITGGTSGIGRQLAETLHDRGNRVIITGRRQALLDEITAKRPAIIGFALDVHDINALSRCAQDIRDNYPELNVLIANAGISRPEDMTADNWQCRDAEEMVETNILGVIRVVSAFLPLLKAQTQATIMATSSALAFVPLAAFPTYCASKAFLHSWLSSLRYQLRASAIEVFELSPPYVQTALTGDNQLTDPRAMPVEEYVAQILAMLEKGDIPRGELLLERDYPRRWAERDGQYEERFRAMNPD